MKHSMRTRRFIFLAILPALIFSACKKDNDNNSNNATGNFPPPVSNLVPPSMIDSLRAVGTKIYDGTTPPIVNGIYLMHPDSCVYDNSPGHFTGTLFDDYRFQFSAQNNTQFTITVAQKAMSSGTLSATPAYTYISGSGNNFSIFIIRTSSPSGIAVQQFNILSGTLTATGIQGFQNTLYLRSKTGDPNNTIAAAGTIRLFVTGAPGLAAISTVF